MKHLFVLEGSDLPPAWSRYSPDAKSYAKALLKYIEEQQEIIDRLKEVAAGNICGYCWKDMNKGE